MTEQNTDTGFSLEKVGKKMPYTVPEGYFGRLQADIILRSAGAPSRPERSPKHRRMNWGAWWCVTASTAAAASVAVLLTVTSPRTAAADQLTVEQAFSNLSAADQEYIIDIFRNDVILDY